MFEKDDLKSRLLLSLVLTIALSIFIVFNGLFFGSPKFIEQFLRAFLPGTGRLFLGVLMYLYIGSALVGKLNEKGIERNTLKRWTIEALTIAAVAGVVSAIGYYAAILLGKPEFTLVNNPGAILFITNFMLGIIIFSVVEIKDSFTQNRQLQINLAKAEKDRIASQLSALQQKVNPHFMFNSLAVLSELIHQDVEKADAFIAEFSNVYRYVLDLNEEPVVTVKQELDFLKSYLFLQKIRFGESLKVENHLDGEILNSYIPPLSLQLLFENAIKHNQVSKAAPLSISLKNENGSLVVKNSLNIRTDVENSKGIGLKNLKEKYRLISEKQPEFFATEEAFVARIPLVKPENY